MGGTATRPGGVRCALMRGGSSKGALLLASDLPADPAARDDLLLRIMGSPDVRQIDGLGGAHPLTSKVAVVSPSPDDAADVDYLFLQVVVDEPVVSTSQTCGNMLAAVAPFAIERGLVPAAHGRTAVRVRMVNTGGIATLTVRTPDGFVTYEGSTAISGVPGTAAPIEIELDAADGALLPTGSAVDTVAGVEVTCIDNGMPSVVVRAADLGLEGTESPSELEQDADVVRRVAQIREGAYGLMGLPGDPATTTTPKIVLVSAPRGDGGTITTRSFIPRRVHEAIGVLGAASVAAAASLPGSVADGVARPPLPGEPLRIEHPTGFLDLHVDPDPADPDPADPVRIGSTRVVRSARLIMDGTVYPRRATTREETTLDLPAPLTKELA